MASAGIFRPGQWVVLNGIVGLLHKRKEKRVDENGKLVEAGPGDEFEHVDTGTPDGESSIKRIAVDAQVDFHPVKEDGTTDHKSIIANVVSLAGEVLAEGLRQAVLAEIPALRRPVEEIAAKFGYV